VLLERVVDRGPRGHDVELVDAGIDVRGHAHLEPGLLEHFARLRALFRQRTRWVQGHYQCWRHLPDLMRSKAVPLGTRIDLSLYLVLVIFVVLVTTGMVFNILATVGVLVTQSTAFDFVPAGMTRNALMLFLSFGPLSVFLLTYQSRTPAPMPVRWLPAYAIVFAVYTYAWMVATAWAWARMLLRRGSWAKTARVGSEAAV